MVSPTIAHWAGPSSIFVIAACIASGCGLLDSTSSAVTISSIKLRNGSPLSRWINSTCSFLLLVASTVRRP